jgi:hypothetical protein
MIYPITFLAMKNRSILLAIALAFFVALASAHAVPVPITYSPSPSDLGDLDHHLVYTWRIDNINVNPATIKGASLTFTSIRNWDQNPNVLHLHLLDTAKGSGVRAFVDDPAGHVPVVDYTDDFISTRYHSQSNWLVAAGTADTFLDNHSFTLTPVTWTYTLSATEVAALRSYVSNGKNIALGFDPDCHFFNNGVQLSLTTTVPETGSTFMMLGAAVAVIFLARPRPLVSHARR